MLIDWFIPNRLLVVNEGCPVSTTEGPGRETESTTGGVEHIHVECSTLDKLT